LISFIMLSGSRKPLTTPLGGQRFDFVHKPQTVRKFFPGKRFRAAFAER